MDTHQATSTRSIHKADVTTFMDRALKHSPKKQEVLGEFIEEFARLAQYSENQNENAK